MAWLLPYLSRVKMFDRLLMDLTNKCDDGIRTRMLQVNLMKCFFTQFIHHIAKLPSLASYLVRHVLGYTIKQLCNVHRLRRWVGYFISQLRYFYTYPAWSQALRPSCLLDSVIGLLCCVLNTLWKLFPVNLDSEGICMVNYASKATILEKNFHNVRS